MRRKVVLYELNEVPWAIVDLYVDRRPRSTLAAFVDGARCLTTICDDPVKLQPWRTWPTFHTSRWAEEHHSLDIGQDPDTFVGDTIWDVAEAAGRSVGLFGPLQSWPPRRFLHGGFFVPDTFAHTAETHPRQLERFQAFNLALTTENAFAASAPLGPRRMVMAGLEATRRGVTPRSAVMVARHLVDERRDPRYRARRPVMQVLPTFDVYWRLHREHRPDLSIFFTNHVAAMLHRYWGDGVPSYASDFDYRPDPVFSRFIVDAMDLFDRQLARIQRDVDPDTVVIIASSMGQAPVPKAEMTDCYVLDRPVQLAAALGVGPAEPGTAMYPRTALLFPDEAAADAAVGPLASIAFDGRERIHDARRMGRTINFALDFTPDTERPADQVPATWWPLGAPEPVTGTVAGLGIEVRNRLGGGNSGLHVPQGILVARGAGVGADRSRREISVLDATPSILELLDVEPSPTMRGSKGALV